MKQYVLAVVIFTGLISFGLKSMDHYEKLITSYCTYYGDLNKFNKKERSEYEEHFKLQCQYGGKIFYQLYHNLDNFKSKSSEAKRSLLCQMICFFYREGLKENYDPAKKALYEVDFHIHDKDKLFYKIFLKKLLKEAKEYEAKYFDNKKEKFYEIYIEDTIEKKPLLPFGHSYIRITRDAGKNIHIRTMPHEYYSSSNVINYFSNLVIDTRNTPGYRKIHVEESILKKFKNVFSCSKKTYVTLAAIVKNLESNQDSPTYPHEIHELLSNITKQYRYPKKMYGNEIYITPQNLLDIIAYLDYLICKKSNNDAEDFSKIIEPFLTLDIMIFEYNNFGKFFLKKAVKENEKISTEEIKEPEEIWSYIKDDVLPLKKKLSLLPKTYQDYLGNVITILELIGKTKTPNKHLLHVHFFNAEEHNTTIDYLKKAINSSKKNLFPDLPSIKENNTEDKNLENDFKELNKEIENKKEEIIHIESNNETKQEKMQLQNLEIDERSGNESNESDEVTYSSVNQDETNKNEDKN